jgi:hypothetical protein
VTDPGHDFKYQAAQRPGTEGPTYAWAAERLVAGAERLTDVFGLIGTIRRRSTDMAVIATAIMDPVTRSLRPSF